jgi:hypothetical protein
VAAGSTALLQIFQKQKILGNLGKFRGRILQGKKKKKTTTTRGVHIILFYFIFNRLISQLWRFLPKF